VPPAPDFGILRGSIGVEKENVLGAVRVGTNVEYAAPLELVMDRPFMATALKRVKDRITGLVTSGLRSAAQPKA
jgi:hypothetical protein